jgi:hypothetical protein
MKKRLRTNLLIFLVLALLVINVFAATPGSPCTITATGPLGVRIVDPGWVSPTGRSCAPTGNQLLFLPLGAGVTCGTTVQVAGFRVRANCPY